AAGRQAGGAHPQTPGRSGLRAVKTGLRRGSRRPAGKPAVQGRATGPEMAMKSLENWRCFPMMFGRFTERAQRVLALAQEEAVRLGHNNIGTEHILLGLI